MRNKVNSCVLPLPNLRCHSRKVYDKPTKSRFPHTINLYVELLYWKNMYVNLGLSLQTISVLTEIVCSFSRLQSIPFFGALNDSFGQS